LADRVLGVLGPPFRGAVYLLLALPAVIVVLLSFTESALLNFPPEGFTLAWYGKAWNSAPFMNSLLVSLQLALLATLLALALGGPAAFALQRYPVPGKRIIETMLLSPLVVPAVVLSVGLLQFLAWVGLAKGMLGLVIGHFLVTLPYVVRTLTASFALFDRRLEQAAMNLRAGPWQVARRITVPLLLPGILSAAVFSFVTSFGNVTVSMFLAYSGRITLPIQIYTYIENSFDPILAAVSTVVIVITIGLMLIVEKLVGMDRLA
jgi:putative spermidine/putrescine transport system permease protein